jgi:hypothetical protein
MFASRSSRRRGSEDVVVASCPSTTTYLIENLETRILLSELLATFAPTLPRVVRPADNPALPVEFDRFLPPGRSGRADAAAPDVAEWTKTGKPGDLLVITGEDFSTLGGSAEGDDTEFVIYGQTRLRQGALKDAKIARLDGQYASIQLNPNLPANSMYFVWPKNADGYGDPVAVNRTEAWWVGPDRAVPGETISLFGRNLSHDGGTTQSWVYVRPAGEGAGQWVRVTAANPYQVNFEVPEELAPGNYEVWVHNGHGGNFGWSAPLTFAVRDDGKWDGPTYNVRDYGAKGDGVTDDYAAIAKVMDKAKDRPGSTIYFPPGTYRVSDAFRGTPEHTRWMGAPEYGTSIKPIDNYRMWPYVFDDIGAGSEIRDLTLDAFSHTETQIGMLARTGETHDVRFVNVRFFGPNAWLDLELSGSKRVIVKNSTVIGRGIHAGQARQIFIDGTKIYGTRDTDVLIWADGSSEISVTNSSGQDYDNSNVNSGRGWSEGRFYMGQGLGASQSHVYLGGNTTHDMGVRPGVADQITGEQFGWELSKTQFTKRLTSATAKSVRFAGLRELSGDRVTIVGGRGVGQSRRIIAFDRSTGIMTLDRPWNVTPDDTSMGSVGFMADRTVVYRNRIDGKAEQVTQADETASTGITLFGASVEFIVDGNVMTDVRYGLFNWMRDGVEHHPFFSNLFVNNAVYNTREGISIHTAGVGNGATAYVGNVYRDNVVNGASVRGLVFRASGAGIDANMNVIERNTFYNTPLGMRVHEDDEGRLRNSLIQRNTFWRGTEPLVPFVSSYGCIFFGTHRESSIRDNVFDGFETVEAIYSP